MKFESWPNGNGWESKTKDGRDVSIMNTGSRLQIVVHQSSRTAFLDNPVKGSPRHISVPVHRVGYAPIGANLADAVADTDRNGELVETGSQVNKWF